MKLSRLSKVMFGGVFSCVIMLPLESSAKQVFGIKNATAAPGWISVKSRSSDSHKDKWRLDRYVEHKVLKPVPGPNNRCLDIKKDPKGGLTYPPGVVGPTDTTCDFF